MSNWAEQIEEDLSWREGELASMKLAMGRVPSGSAAHRALLRALWVMLYAHYEGFFKFAWQVYLDGIQRSGGRRCEYADPIAVLSLTKAFSQLRRNTSPAALWAFCTKRFSDCMKAKMAFDTSVVDLTGDSNLWPGVVRERCRSAGLPHSMVDAHEAKLKALVSRRNDIAHGKAMAIKSLDEYQPYEDAAFFVMCELAVAVVDSLDAGSYLRKAPSSKANP